MEKPLVMTEKSEEYLEKSYEKESALFWDRKARFTYYLLTLPFALFGGAIASYKPANVEIYQLCIEVIAWLVFLGSGLFGLLAKWGEMEAARMSSVIAQADLAALKRDKKEREQWRTPQYAELWMNQERRRFKAENAESLGSKYLKISFPLGCFILVISRVLLHT
jgi:hypothetical protein